MCNRKNGLISGPFAGGIREIVLSDKVAGDDFRQSVGVQHGLHHKMAQLGGRKVAAAVGLHRQRGRVNAFVRAVTGLFEDTKLPEGFSGMDM